ncbi:MAG: Protein-L-isoaspartate O-methyltransferase [Alphaproteobacteria bacterium MarineAlpha11_Bin1]|nr:MAG: Protein-L-isoaspartate O-methyltransferase [Alphaproteobacteria bacterium MarineAlpha11_Bin1]|tara:strand:- start:1381 stop:2007 length:627 start_codon:yes stop_codon:yes gene_type:complete
MVDTQLRTNKVRDERILAAMGEIPREDFIPTDISSLAYIDEDIPIGSSRGMIEPMILGRMIQATELKSDEVVLDVASGTGYSAAVLGRIARVVVAVESDEDLVKKSTLQMVELGMDNVVIEQGPIELGWLDQAPYDVILVNGALGKVPETYFDQLSEGGRLCAIRKEPNGIGSAWLWVKQNGTPSGRPLFDANIFDLPELKCELGFTF